MHHACVPCNCLFLEQQSVQTSSHKLYSGFSQTKCTKHKRYFPEIPTATKYWKTTKTRKPAETEFNRMHCCKKMQFFVQSAQYLPIGVHLRFSGMREDAFYAKCGLSAA